MRNRLYACLDDWIQDPRMRHLLAILLLVWWPYSVIAQQEYNRTEGYTCNGPGSTCSTYAFYRTFKEEQSLAEVAAYFNATPADVAGVSGLTDLAPNAALPIGQPLYIPLECTCDQDAATSQTQVLYTIKAGDTFALVATTIFGSLTTYQAIEVWNPRIDVYNLVSGDTVRVPIFCACPTTEQIADRTKLLLTYGIFPHETLESISGNFGITTAQLSAANRLKANSTLGEYTTLLVPVQALPPIANMTYPHVITSATNTNSSSTSSQRRHVMAIIAGLSAGAVAVVLVAGLITKRYRRKESLSDYSLVDPNLALRMFTYKELCRATRNFRRSGLLGSGGFGAVYKGTLPSGALVAVKRMRMESKHGKESFLAEVTSFSHIRHRNLVQLRGWCHEEEELLLVYDYMCNGSLDEWLFQFSESCKKQGIKSTLRDAQALPLKLRHSILRGMASALAYLHEECAQCVLHRDIKSSNVLLDAEMNAYLGDFGLARLIDHQKMARTTMMAGTLGYLAPEMSHTGKATKETDVYSFGVLMLEVMCGKQPLDVAAIEQGEGLLEDRVWRAHEEGHIVQAADPSLGISSFSDANSSSFGGFESPEVALDGAMDEKRMITNLLQLGLLCCHPSPGDRPSMRLVSQLMLLSSEDMEMSLPCLPEWKPQVHYSRPGGRGFSQVL